MSKPIPTGPTLWKIGERTINVTRIDELFEIEAFSRQKIRVQDFVSDAEGNRYRVEGVEPIKTNFANVSLLVRKFYPIGLRD